jgi:hypothetical protein
LKTTATCFANVFILFSRSASVSGLGILKHMALSI